MTKETIIRNALECSSCGETIVSRHVHDYVTCSCGKCMVDGGTEYLRRSRSGFEIEKSLYSDAPHEEQRTALTWGSYGKGGDQPLRLIPIADMETDHIMAVLQNCKPASHLKNCMEKELEFRAS